ncbi:MAG TPA: di-heme-cytochrome C peroxidase [Blastocatellia bacterium]|nr:di-heme-cytochrome C peroxidase [Blastocatellia bacterium]
MRNAKITILLTALLLGLGLLLTACEPKTRESLEPSAPAGALLGTNGLSAPERQKFYHLPEGSELYPYAWARALISSQTSKPFLENLERFGLIPDPQSQGNPYGLPVGITVAKRRGVGDIQMIGVNCSACHVGQFSYKGRSFRVDGAPNLFDIEMFYGELASSTQETIKDPDKLWAFVKRYLAEKETPAESVPAAPASASGKQGEARAYKFGDGTRKILDSFNDLKAMTDKGEMEKALASKIQATVKEEIEKAKSDYTSSVDPLDQAKKELSATLEKDVASLVDKTPGAGSPLAVGGSKQKAMLREVLSDIKTNVALFRSYIKLFQGLAAAGKDPKDTPGGFGRVDAFGSARFLMFGSENRQPTTAPVSYPYLWGMKDTAWLHYNANTNSVVERNIGQALGLGATYDAKSFETTVNIENALDLEWLAYNLTPPVWPEELFGKVDVEKANRGKDLYEQNCARCHDKYETTSEGLHDYQLFPFEEIGTDRNQAENFHHPLTLNGKQASFAEENGKVVDLIKVAYYKKYNISPEQQKKWEGNRTPIVWRDVLSKPEYPKVYRARPLAGIWATGPYLHNGSVPTLYALLLPGDKRPTEFYVGNREYDSKDLGYLTTQGSISFKFETSRNGNSNRGHEYGTSLTDDERYSLLEYIKSLK